MGDRVKVTDPYTGVVLEVPADSPQATLWGKPEAPAKKTPAKKSGARS